MLAIGEWAFAQECGERCTPAAVDGTMSRQHARADASIRQCSTTTCPPGVRRYAPIAPMAGFCTTGRPTQSDAKAAGAGRARTGVPMAWRP